MFEDMKMSQKCGTKEPNNATKQRKQYKFWAVRFVNGEGRRTVCAVVG
jgi:hypothetical protein